MLRISGGLMSGTAEWCLVLHVSPGGRCGPLAFVRDGDIIELGMDARRICIEVGEAEMGRRRGELQTANVICMLDIASTR